MTVAKPGARDVPLPKSDLLLNRGPVTLVPSQSGPRTNVMAASSAMPLDFDPPRIVLIIDRTTPAREFLDASGEFALNIPPRALADATPSAGSASGRAIDK
jgi:flavin reductase (DIM6/NTAB) family NADH-FMN oxidoreductase RutF